MIRIVLTEKKQVVTVVKPVQAKQEEKKETAKNEK